MQILKEERARMINAQKLDIISIREAGDLGCRIGKRKSESKHGFRNFNKQDFFIFTNLI